MSVFSQSYSSLWKQVDEAQSQSLPQTVESISGRIYQKALREHNAGQLFKAWFTRAAAVSQVTPDSSYVHFRQLEEWVATEENVSSRAILHALLGNLYAVHRTGARYRMSDATEIDTSDYPADMREWTPALYTRKALSHIRQSLEPRQDLLKASARDYVPFAVLGDGSSLFNHDLYHIVAMMAVDSYNTLDATAYADEIEAIYQAMQLTYEGIDGRAEATLQVALLRLQRSGGVADIADYDELIMRYEACPMVADAYVAKARLVKDDHPAQALAWLDEAIARYPKYARIGEAKNLRQSILMPSVRLTTAALVHPNGTLDVDIRYRNVRAVTLRLVRTSLQSLPEGYQTDSVMASYVSQGEEILTQTITLDGNTDPSADASDRPYLQASQWVSISLSQDPGIVIIEAQPVYDTAVATVQPSYAFVSLSRFATAMHNLGDGRYEVITLDRQTGHPIAGATVTFYSPDNRGAKMVQQVETGADGTAIFRPAAFGSIYYVATKDADRFMTQQRQYFSKANDNTYHPADNEKLHLELLTDRTIYRPGQIVYVKGIAYVCTPEGNHVVKDKAFEIALHDVNSEEVSSQKAVTNEFGSFSLSFVLPTTCLNGQFSVSDNDASTAYFRVEEYKRPTFDISFDPVEGGYRVGDTVLLTGSVSSYSGAPVQHLPVAYRLINERRTYRFRRGEDQPQLADTVRLDANGRFAIPVSLAENGRYRVDLSVTSDAGETQTASQSIYVDQQAYSILVDGFTNRVCKSDNQTIKPTTVNRAMQPVDLTLRYRLYRLDKENEAVATDAVPLLQGTWPSNQPVDLSSWKDLPSAVYCLQMDIAAEDSLPQTQRATYTNHFVIFDETDTRLQSFVPSFLHVIQQEFGLQQDAKVMFGTSYTDTYVLYDILADGRRIDTQVLRIDNQIVTLSIPYKEEYGTEATVSFLFIRDGEWYQERCTLRQTQAQEQLVLKWNVFRDQLLPGQQEEWTLNISRSDGQPADAELLALLYDASLDRLMPNNQQLNVARYSVRRSGVYVRQYGRTGSRSWSIPFNALSFKVPSAAVFDHFDYPSFVVFPREETILFARNMRLSRSANISVDNEADVILEDNASEENVVEAKAMAATSTMPAGEAESLPQLRTDFNETVFFYPHLRTDAQGDVSISFTIPQSVTQWNFRGYAHTADMIIGTLQAVTQTSKQLMVQPNMPRYVRQDDQVVIAASVSNLTDEALSGMSRMELFDPLTDKLIDTQRQPFIVAAQSNTAVSFTFTVDQNISLLGVRIIVDSGTFSDGEQHLLPVLSNSLYMTETLPMPIRGNESREYSADSLINQHDEAATDCKLAVQYTGNPAWLAVQALPTATQPTSDNAIAWVSAFYANAVASMVMQANPSIQNVLAQWQATDKDNHTFRSQLDQNAALKEILLQETPWVMDAENETDRMQRLSTLFDSNQLNDRLHTDLLKLQALQHDDGGWSWFSGMQSGISTTTYVMGVLLRLQMQAQTGCESLDIPYADELEEMVSNAFAYLPLAALREYQQLLKQKKDIGRMPEYLTTLGMQYLYLLSLSHAEVPNANREAYDYYLSLVPRQLQHGSVIDKAQSAIILSENHQSQQAQQFVASLLEHLVYEDEVGAHFAFLDTPTSWRMMPIPSQVAVIEALQWVGGHDDTVEEMKLWILKQKQVNAWNSSLCTTDAVYALLSRGVDLLANQGDVQISIGNQTLATAPDGQPAVAGLAIVSETYTDQPTLDAPVIRVQKDDDGIAWGAAYAQYFIPMDHIKAATGGALSVSRQLYVEKTDSQGHKTLQPFGNDAALRIGDVVVSRLVLTLDRAMEYIQLTDRTAACLEPVASTSGYRWQNTASYYEEVGDAVSNLFFDHLGKGVHTLEVRYRVCRAGAYTVGSTTAQSAYSPEFASHSAGGSLVVPSE